jgi:hypothetical protein
VDAERFVEEVRGDEPQLAELLSVEAIELATFRLARACRSASSSRRE